MPTHWRHTPASSRMVATINAASLLAAWESAASVPMSRRASILLSCLSPDRSADEWAARTLGERDNTLLRLREALFGERLDTTTRCLHCGEAMEAQLRTRDLYAPFATPQPQEYHVGPMTVRFRAPSQADLTQALSSADPQRTLLDRCVESPAELDREAVDAVIAAMAESDPQADVRIQIACPVCGVEQELTFDIVSYFWEDLSEWARRLLADVHTLALTYGWREADILAMSAFRRRLYLQMIGRES